MSDAVSETGLEADAFDGDWLHLRAAMGALCGM